jgi:hypothetical protein
MNSDLDKNFEEQLDRISEWTKNGDIQALRSFIESAFIILTRERSKKALHKNEPLNKQNLRDLDEEKKIIDLMIKCFSSLLILEELSAKDTDEKGNCYHAIYKLIHQESSSMYFPAPSQLKELIDEFWQTIDPETKIKLAKIRKDELEEIDLQNQIIANTFQNKLVKRIRADIEALRNCFDEDTIKLLNYLDDNFGGKYEPQKAQQLQTLISILHNIKRLVSEGNEGETNELKQYVSQLKTLIKQNMA